MPNGPAFGFPIFHLTPVLAGEFVGRPVHPDDPVQQSFVDSLRFVRHVDRVADQRAERALGIWVRADRPLVHLHAIVDNGLGVVERGRYRVGPVVPFDHEAAIAVHLLDGRVHGQLRGRRRPPAAVRQLGRGRVAWPAGPGHVLVSAVLGVVLAARQPVRAAQKQRRLRLFVRVFCRLPSPYQRRHVHPGQADHVSLYRVAYRGLFCANKKKKK